jgi:hypothetical protein
MPFFKRIFKKLVLKIKDYLNPEELFEEYKEKAVKKYTLFQDYDEFRDFIKNLPFEKRKEFGKLCEKYFSQYVIYKVALEDLGESEFFPFYYKKSQNQRFFTENFIDKELKVVLAEDFSYGREILEFKSAKEERELKDKLKEGYCQALFYAFLEYNNSSFLYRTWRRLFFYKIIVEVYVAEKNKVYIYSFNLKPTDFDLLKQFSNFVKQDTSVDIYNLIKNGESEYEQD